MATVEGRGMVAPTPVRIPITQLDIRWLERVANKRDKHRGYGRSSSQWKRGSCSDPILVGLVGEFAFERLLRTRQLPGKVVDDSLNDGDGGKDAEICGVTYQVKTSQKIYPTCLIRRVSEQKRLLSLVADRFVFCAWSPGDSGCWLRGWCDQETVIENGKLRPSKRGNWHNTELDHCRLLPMSDLVMLIKQEIELG